MHITAELSQRIVDTIMPVVHRNVNVMDLRGVIIASGHPHRIGTVHTGARLAVETGQTIEIFPDELSRYPGALQGINIPIARDGQTIGVVGVFGDPPTVRDTAQLVRMITELVLEREGSQRETGSHERMREEFLQLLTQHDGRDLPATALRLARSMGFDPGLPRAVAIFRAVSSGASWDAVPDLLSDLPLARIETNLRARKSLEASDFVGRIGATVVVLFAELAPTSVPVMNRLAQVHRSLAHLSGAPVIAGLGGAAPPGAFPNSWREAEFAAGCATSHAPIRSIVEHDVLLVYLREQAASRDQLITANPVLTRLRQAFRERPVLRETVNALLEANLDGAATARRLSIHRNTLAYRLDQLRDAAGLDPCRNFVDAVLCWFAVGAAGSPPKASPPAAKPTKSRTAPAAKRPARRH